ncbi:C40 family peptidase [Nocardioides sp. HDW12B]|nr:C40 family peptidase [Nocardioides sp. HDW12B]
MAPAVAAPYDQARERAAALGAAAQRLSTAQERVTTDLRASNRQLARVQDQLKEARTTGRETRSEIVSALLDDAATGSNELALDLFSGSEDLDIELVSEKDTDMVATQRRAARAVERLEEREQELQMQLRRLDVTRDRQQPKVAAAQQRADQAAQLVEQIREERASRAAERAEQQEAAQAATGASAVVSYALAQVGDPYVWGAAGPDSFDCSGFTMAAWAQAGVSLPHNSGAQMGSGTPVSTDSLVPGDLVFYYSPVSHVGIYVGNGQIVHAGNPSIGVTTAPLHQMPLVGAVRPG